MKLGRVIGTVVATCRYEGLEGVKLLVVQPLDESLKPEGRPQVAADATAQAGPGELVFVVASREAAQALPEVFVPVDLAGPGDTVLVMDEGNGARQILGLDPGAIRAVVVGVVDEVSIGG